LGYDEALAHRIIAGSDVILVPSRFEPCGLTQLYGLRYGTLPLVRRTGGLNDTVIDATPANIANDTATGFIFEHPSSAALIGAINRAFVTWRERSVWEKVVRRAMAQNFSWQEAAAEYVELYRELRSA
jgi:starch synthase